VEDVTSFPLLTSKIRERSAIEKRFRFGGLEWRGTHMALSIVLDELDEALTSGSKVAAKLDDEFLVNLIDMAILYVRTKAIHLEDNFKHRRRSVSYTHKAKSEYTRCAIVSATP
jgi:hypothetical protein